MKDILRHTLLFFTLLIPFFLGACTSTEKRITAQPTASHKTKPNIIIFYVDDLGWGDIGAYGATQVKTPNVDSLAHNGMRFTDGHSSAATCTPSRYSLLTGEHAFRKQINILNGDAGMVISTNQHTLPKMLKSMGYKTGVVGKWHLGFGDGQKPIDWNRAVKPGPLEIGFDYSHLIPVTGDRVPAVYLNGHYVENLDKMDPLYVSYTQKIGERPTGYENSALRRQVADKQHNQSIINGVSRIGWMQGGKNAEWRDEDFPYVKTKKAKAFIDRYKNQPFFLFFSFHDIHVPRLPEKAFQGKTSMGPRGDAIVQMDWITGQIVNHLKQKKLLNNTLIIFTSDNGAVLSDGYKDRAIEQLGDHEPNGPYSGGKYSALEGGTRVPFIVHYPNKVQPGVSDALVSQIDIYASLASMLDKPLTSNEAIDSENTIRTFFGESHKGKNLLIEESFTLSLRKDQWKYIKPSKKNLQWIKRNKKIRSGIKKHDQLYDLSKDPKEKYNLAKSIPEKTRELSGLLKTQENKKARENDN